MVRTKVFICVILDQRFLSEKPGREKTRTVRRFGKIAVPMQALRSEIFEHFILDQRLLSEKSGREKTRTGAVNAAEKPCSPVFTGEG
jgi:hypothetical protein